jgi:hypothetical protein
MREREREREREKEKESGVEELAQVRAKEAGSLASGCVGGWLGEIAGPEGGYGRSGRDSRRPVRGNKDLAGAEAFVFCVL